MDETKGREPASELDQEQLLDRDLGRRKDLQDLEAERLYLLTTDALLDSQEVLDEIANALRRAAGLEPFAESWSRLPKESACFHCGSRAQGRFAMHRDGFGLGPQLPLCDRCGGNETPTCEEIWARALQKRLEASLRKGREQ